MDLVDALRGPAGPAAFWAGMSPAEPALALTGDTIHRPDRQSGCDLLSPTHAVQPVEMDV